MSAAPSIDLSAIPESQRAAVLAVLRERDALQETNRRLEHLIAELNQVLHGKRSEKLNDDERQLAFEDLETALAEAETRQASACALQQRRAPLLGGAPTSEHRSRFNDSRKAARSRPCARC